MNADLRGSMDKRNVGKHDGMQAGYQFRIIRVYLR
jgi:hypothetical protein